MKSKIEKKILDIAKELGILRPRDLREYNIPRIYLTRMCKKGLLERVERGIYTLADVEPSENYTLAQIGKRIPEGVICLLSALQFHEITTQQPFEVWVAVDMKGRHPKIINLPVRIVRFSGDALTEGIERHLIDDVPVKVYNPSKTVADCFKYRNKIGLDVALESLRACRLSKKCSHEELWYYAKICRVTNIMRPYLEFIK